MEALAISALDMSEPVTMLVGYGLAVIGFVIGATLSRGSERSIPRVPYFIGTAVLAVFGSSLGFVWLGLFAALENGILWILYLAIYGGIILFGAALGMISRARSVNGYGDGRSTWMGIVPIANLILIFKPPLEKGPSAGAMHIVGNVVGILLGIFLLAFSKGIEVTSSEMLDGYAEAYGENPENEAKALMLSIKSMGLEQFMRDMATYIEPKRIDDITYLKSLEVNGRTATYTYELSSGFLSDTINSAMRRGVSQNVCENQVLFILMAHEATIDYRYLDEDGRELGVVSTTADVCFALSVMEDADIGTPEASNTSPKAQFTTLNAEEIISESGAAQMYFSIKNYFPDEAAYFVERMVQILNQGGSQKQTNLAAFETGADIRKRNAHYLLNASEESLRTIMAEQIRIYELFEDKPVICNKLLTEGFSDIPAAEKDELLKEMDDHGLLYRAMHEGKATPVKRRKLTDDDWADFGEKTWEIGPTAEQYDLIANVREEDPGYCGATLAFLRAVRDAKYPGSDVIVAHMVTNIMKE